VTGSQVRVVYRKYDGSLHWNHTGIRLGEDEFGRWVATPGGTPIRRGDAPPTPAQWPNVLLFPRDGWWTGCFNAAPHRTEVYCDITTVPQWTEAEVSMVDLDLDVRRRRAGEVELLDADEFAAHRVRFGYPFEVVARAQATAEWLTGAVRGRAEPFGTAYQAWLDQVT
jgi:protein associated with RNAse G/E